MPLNRYENQYGQIYYAERPMERRNLAGAVTYRPQGVRPSAPPVDQYWTSPSDRDGTGTVSKPRNSLLDPRDPNNRTYEGGSFDDQGNFIPGRSGEEAPNSGNAKGSWVDDYRWGNIGGRGSGQGQGFVKDQTWQSDADRQYIEDFRPTHTPTGVEKESADGTITNDRAFASGQGAWVYGTKDGISNSWEYVPTKFDSSKSWWNANSAQISQNINKDLKTMGRDIRGLLGYAEPTPESQLFPTPPPILSNDGTDNSLLSNGGNPGLGLGGPKDRDKLTAEELANYDVALARYNAEEVARNNDPANWPMSPRLQPAPLYENAAAFMQAYRDAYGIPYYRENNTPILSNDGTAKSLLSNGENTGLGLGGPKDPDKLTAEELADYDAIAARYNAEKVARDNPDMAGMNDAPLSSDDGEERHKSLADAMQRENVANYNIDAYNEQNEADKPWGMADGGPVERLSSDLERPKNPGVADDLPRNLSEGEFVIPAKIVDKYGESAFRSLLADDIGMAEGGPVATNPAGATDLTGSERISRAAREYITAARMTGNIEQAMKAGQTAIDNLLSTIRDVRPGENDAALASRYILDEMKHLGINYLDGTNGGKTTGNIFQVNPNRASKLSDGIPGYQPPKSSTTPPPQPSLSPLKKSFNI